MNGNPMPEDHYRLDRAEGGTSPTPQEAALAALERLRGLSYTAAAKIERILKKSKTPDRARLAAISIVLDRVYGKPEETLRFRDGERSQEASAARIDALAERIRRKAENEKTQRLED